MPKRPASFSSIDEYIDAFPKRVQVLLRKVRRTIRAAAPDAEEAIAYGIPTFKLCGNLVHFAGFSRHIGFYPGPSGIAKFKSLIAEYSFAKGSVQFPLDREIPVNLIKKIVDFRVKENLAAFNQRKSEKKSVKRITRKDHPN